MARLYMKNDNVIVEEFPKNDKVKRFEFFPKSIKNRDFGKNLLWFQQNCFSLHPVRK